MKGASHEQAHRREYGTQRPMAAGGPNTGPSFFVVHRNALTKVDKNLHWAYDEGTKVEIINEQLTKHNMKRKNYEVQRWSETSMVWVPIAHDDDEREAVRKMREAKMGNDGSYRVLDKTGAARDAAQVAFAGNAAVHKATRV